MNIKQLKTNGFMSVTYPPTLRTAVSDAVVSWKAFCALPLEVKAQLPYSNNTAGVGYEMKDGSGPKGDRKENFDVALGGREWLLKNVVKQDNSSVLKFINDAISLVTVIKPLIVEFAREVEKEFGLEGFQEEVAGSEDSYFIRFIHNFEGAISGEVITSAHPDQSGFTPHLFESHPGLQCMSLDESLPTEERWIDMPVSQGQTVIIPSMQMQLRSGGELKALCHRVVANGVTAKEGRYSAVCFVQLKNTPKYDKATHGRLQEKVEGFNYKMLHDKFAKLFK